MTCVGGGIKQQQQQCLDCRTWDELLENKKIKKREDRLILTLHPAPLLQYSPVSHFYFPGSPLGSSSRCLHLSVSSFLSNGASVISFPLVWDIRTDNGPLSPPEGSSLAPPTCSHSRFKRDNKQEVARHTNRLWVRLHACSRELMFHILIFILQSGSTFILFYPQNINNLIFA